MAPRGRTTLGSYLFVLILCTNFIASLQQYCDNNNYVIRSTHSTGLVLDGQDPSQVRVQQFNGFATQLWNFESGERPGLLYIVNSYYRNVLDVIEGRDGFIELILNGRNYSLQQQWSATLNNTISNAANFKNIDIHKAVFVAGNRATVGKRNGRPNQEFVLQKAFRYLEVLN